jgi:hypothetical protein
MRDRSKRNVVGLGWGGVGFGRLWRGGRGRSGGWTAPSVATVAAVHELKVFDNHLEFALLLVRVFIFPLVESQPAFDQDRAPLFQVLADDFGRAPERVRVHKGRFFLGFAGSLFQVRLIARPIFAMAMPLGV